MTRLLRVKYTHHMTNPLIENSKRYALTEIETEIADSNPSRNFINTLVETFLSRYADELFPNPAFYMNGPVAQIEGDVVEARSARFKTDYSFNILRDFDDEITDGEKISRFKESLAAELREFIAEAEAQGQIVCPYMIGTTGWIINEHGAPTVKFLFRHGKTQRLPDYGDIEPASPLSILFENAKRIMSNLSNFSGKTYSEALPEYRNFVRGFLHRYGDAILVNGSPLPYLTEDVEVVRLKTTLKVTGDVKAAAMRHYIKTGVYEDLYEEIDAIQGKLGNTGQRMAVHAPLICSGMMIDPETFEPVLTFSTAFAKVPWAARASA
jgi:hypothetical protein